MIGHIQTSEAQQGPGFRSRRFPTRDSSAKQNLVISVAVWLPWKDSGKDSVDWHWDPVLTDSPIVLG